MLGQTLVARSNLKKPSVLSRGHSFDLKFMKLCQISSSSSKLGQVKSKIRFPGQVLEKKKPCVHFRGHSFSPKFMKLCQIVNHQNV